MKQNMLKYFFIAILGLGVAFAQGKLLGSTDDIAYLPFCKKYRCHNPLVTHRSDGVLSYHYELGIKGKFRIALFIFRKDGVIVEVSMVDINSNPMDKTYTRYANTFYSEVIEIMLGKKISLETIEEYFSKSKTEYLRTINNTTVNFSQKFKPSRAIYLMELQ